MIEMLRSKRHYAVIVLILVALVLFFGGCGKKKEVSEERVYSGEVYPENGLPKDRKVTISAIYPVAGCGKEYFEYAVETFQKKFKNVKINVRYIEEGVTTYNQIIQAMIQSGNDDDMYDWISSTYDLSLMQQGKLEYQDELWERTLYDRSDKKVKDVIIADKSSVFVYFGHMWAAPINYKIYGLYYNKKWFKALGLSEQPKDWHEFLSLCKKIKAKGVYPMVMAGKYASSYFDYGWGTIPYAVDDSDKYSEDEYNYRPDLYISKPYVTMLKRLEEFVAKGYLHPGTASFDHTQSQMEFVQGKAAMITNGTWIANEMKNVVPDDFEWGFMVFPGNDPNKNQVILAQTGVSGFIWKNRPELNKKWVKEFNLWLLNLDIQQKYAQSGGVPTRKDFKLGEEQTKTISPSVVEALKAIRRKGIALVDNKPRVEVITNSEFAKFGKIKGDGYIALITGGKSAGQVAKDINKQYMKGLEANKRK